MSSFHQVGLVIFYRFSSIIQVLKDILIGKLSKNYFIIEKIR